MFEHHADGSDGAQNMSSVPCQNGLGQAPMSFSGDIRKPEHLLEDQRLVDANIEAPSEIRPCLGALDYPSHVTDFGDLFTWDPFNCLGDLQYSAFFNNGAGLNGLDTPCRQIPLPFEPSPVSETLRLGTPIAPPTEEGHQSSHVASHVDGPMPSSSTSPRGDLDPPSENDILIAENFFHVSAVTYETYEKIQSFYQAQMDICFKKLAFPDIKRLNCLVQLYFEHFNAQMSFIHPVIFEKDGSWILVLAVAVIGSQYTRMAMGKQYIIVLSELLRRAIPLGVSTPKVSIERNSTMLTAPGR